MVALIPLLHPCLGLCSLFYPIVSIIYFLFRWSKGVYLVVMKAKNKEGRRKTYLQNFFINAPLLPCPVVSGTWQGSKVEHMP